jgi:hypothetical protein
MVTPTKQLLTQTLFNPIQLHYIKEIIKYEDSENKQNDGCREFLNTCQSIFPWAWYNTFSSPFSIFE